MELFQETLFACAQAYFSRINMALSEEQAQDPFSEEVLIEKEILKIWDQVKLLTTLHAIGWAALTFLFIAIDDPMYHHHWHIFFQWRKQSHYNWIISSAGKRHNMF